MAVGGINNTHSKRVKNHSLVWIMTKIASYAMSLTQDLPNLLVYVIMNSTLSSKDFHGL